MYRHIIVSKEGLSTDNLLFEVKNRLHHRHDYSEREAVLRGAEQMNLKNRLIYVL